MPVNYRVGRFHDPKDNGVSVKLADRLLDVLKGEEFRDAICALKIAMMLLPVSSSRIPGGTLQVPEESARGVQ